MFTTEDLRLPLTSPLTSSRNLLSGTVNENFVVRVAKIDPYMKRFFSIGLNTAISASGKIPYISVAMRIDLPYFLRVLGATAELIAFGLLDVWVIKDTANDLCGARTQAELQLRSGNSRGVGVQSLVLITAIAGAAFAQLPSALPALNYQVPYTNESFAVLMISGMYYSIRSLKLSIEKALDKRNEINLENGPKIAAARQVLTSMIENRRQLFLRSDQSAQLNFSRSMEELSLEEYLKNAIGTSSEMINPQVNQTTDKVIYLFGTYLVVFMQLAMALYTWVETAEHLTKNTALLITFTAAEIVSNAYLMGLSMVETTKAIANTLLRRKEVPSLASQLNSSLTRNLDLLAALISFLGCYATTWVIWGDFFKDPTLALYFQCTMCFNFFLILLTANRSLAEQVAEEMVFLKGTLDQKTVLKMYRDLQQLRELVEQCSLKDFARFLQHDCPQIIQQQVLQQTNLSDEELNRFVSLDQPRQLSVLEIL